MTEIRSLRILLACRGFRYLRHGDFSLTIYPTKNLGSPEEIFFETGAAERYYSYLGRYSFRKILRHLVARKAPVDYQELRSLCSEPTLGDFKLFLLDSGILEVSGDNTWALKQRVESFGYTLECYVTKLLLKELRAIGEWSIRIEGVLAGGDFDVLAFIDSVLVYVECKAKRPEDIEEGEIRNFLQRSADLAPELAIMLVDTDSELDALVDWFQTILLASHRVASAIRDPNWRPEKPFIRRVAGFRQMYFGLRRIFVTNSQPSILRALQDSLRYYHTYVKFASFWGGPRVNYLTGETMDD